MEQDNQETYQSGDIVDILNSAFQSITGAICATAKLAHAPEYTDARATVDFKVHKEYRDDGQPHLKFETGICVYLDGKPVTQAEVQEIFDTNPMLVEMERRLVVEQQQYMQEQRNAQAVHQKTELILPN
jgi:hypothetical protein